MLAYELKQLTTEQIEERIRLLNLSFAHTASRVGIRQLTRAVEQLEKERDRRAYQLIERAMEHLSRGRPAYQDQDPGDRAARFVLMAKLEQIGVSKKGARKTA